MIKNKYCGKAIGRFEDLNSYFKLKIEKWRPLKDPLFRQLNQTHKMIIEGHRIVKISNEIECKMKLNKNLDDILMEMKNRSELGQSFKPYLSKTAKAKNYNDKFLNATGFHHLHLAKFKDIKNGKRSKDLLIVRVLKNTIYMIDILPHPQLNQAQSDPNRDWKKAIHLYEIILHNWPLLMRPNYLISTVNEMTGPIKNMLDTEAWHAINNGIMVGMPLSDGNVYRMFGLIMTDGSSGEILRQYDRILDKF